MKLKSRLQKWLVLPVVGLILALSAIFTPVATVHAEPEDQSTSETETTNENGAPEESQETTENSENQTENGENNTTNGTESQEENTDGENSENSEENKDEEVENTCYDQVEGIGWLVCPTTGVFAKAIDAIYSIIEDILTVQPMTASEESPVYIVWQYARDITNIVFVILLLVVIWSQLTGVGINNYGIKKVLPRLIIAAVLVNLSFIICALAVDTSNILGASIRGFFQNVQETAVANSDISAGTSWTDLVAGLFGGGAVAGIAIVATGGFKAFLWMLIGAVIAALLAVFTGLVTIALRQAVVFMLVMIAPLAFVAYLLPNTERWFKKWKDILFSMLIFYPMFSLLFGAAQLAGWALIASSNGNGFWVILGMAVQVVPLFLSVSLMKMSGTVLGTISNKLSGITARPSNFAKEWAGSHRAQHQARTQRLALEGKSKSATANVRAALARRKAIRETSIAKNQESTKQILGEYTDARSIGRRIIGYREDGSAVYSSVVKPNEFMRDVYANKQAGLRSEAAHRHAENALGSLGDYMKSNGINDADLNRRSAQQAQNYIDLRTEDSAARRNARADERFYFEQVRRAAERDKNGRLKDAKSYRRLVEGGAGYDIYSTDRSVHDNATASVVADAYTAYEKERKLTTENYGTYYSKAVTKEVLDNYKNMLEAGNIDGIVAAQNTLAMRGDYDKIAQYLTAYMDHSRVADKDGNVVDFSHLKNTDYVKLGSDFANTLASNLLTMKDAAPALGRLGKAINMETWSYTSGERNDAPYYTMQEYVTGLDMAGNEHKRTSLPEQVKGTSIKNIDRTGFAVLEGLLQHYSTDNEDYRNRHNETLRNFMPQVISALPNMETDGEQILNTLSFMTGMKYSVKSNKWEPSETGPNLDMIDLYLKSLTANDLMNMKTNTLHAIGCAIAKHKGVNAYNAQGKFDPPKEVYDEIHEHLNKNTIASTQNAITLGVGSGMKNTLIEKLGFKVPGIE